MCSLHRTACNSPKSLQTSSPSLPTVSDPDARELVELRKERLKLQIKVLRLQEEYYTRRLRLLWHGSHGFTITSCFFSSRKATSLQFSVDLFTFITSLWDFICLKGSICLKEKMHSHPKHLNWERSNQIVRNKVLLYYLQFSQHR